MTEDIGGAWDSEQWVIDRLVEAVDVGDAQAKQRLAKRLLDGYSQNGWRLRHVTDAGVLLTNEQLDPSLANSDELADVLEEFDVSEARLEKILSGSKLNESEATQWRDHVVGMAFDPEQMFENRAHICVVLQVRHSDRRRVHLAFSEWDGRSGLLLATYPAYTEVMNALRSAGIVKMDEGLSWEERNRSDLDGR